MSKVNLVCIIDDDKIYRYTIEKYIKMLDLAEEVILYSDGEDALDFLKANAKEKDKLPDIIFLDVNMPLLDGWEFMEAYQSVKLLLEKEIRIYMVSSSIDERDKTRAINIPGICDFIVKPIEEQHLRNLMKVDH